MGKVLLDDFTLMLLEVYRQLVIKDAMPGKQLFANGLGITLASFNKIEKKERSFPKAKRDTARSYLNTYFFVSKQYIDRQILPVFDKEPPKRRFIPDETVPYNGKTVISIEKLQREFQDLQKKYVSIEAENLVLRERIEKYETKKDAKPDKNSDRVTKNSKK